MTDRPEKADPGGAPDTARFTRYSLRDVARLTGASPDQLRRWHKNGMLPARSEENGALWYGFPDLAAARTAIDLKHKGLSTQSVRAAVEAVRLMDPDVVQPLALMRVSAEKGRLTVRLDDTLVEARTGQTLLDLPMGPLLEAAGEVIRMRPRSKPPKPADEPQDAEGWLQQGLDAEATGDIEGAEMAYRRALANQPAHPGALLNLGNLVYARGELRKASDLYRAATRAAPDYPQAWYNLANVLDDLGHADAAARAYDTALELDPTYADAHFNLALLWEKQGVRDRARLHWTAYLGLDPAHPSAEIARRFLESEES